MAARNSGQGWSGVRDSEGRNSNCQRKQMDPVQTEVGEVRLARRHSLPGQTCSHTKPANGTQVSTPKTVSSYLMCVPNLKGKKASACKNKSFRQGKQESGLKSPDYWFALSY